MDYLAFAREYKNIFSDASPDDVKQAYEVSQRNDNLGKFTLRISSQHEYNAYFAV